MDVESNSEAPEKNESQPDLSRRGFVRTSGKALYLAPTLALLGSVQHAAALPSGPPCDPGGGTCDSIAPAAPAAPAPTI